MKPRFLLFVLVACFTMTAGAQNYLTGNPADEANYGYLKHYLPLKQYIDYEKYPNFKLGLARRQRLPEQCYRRGCCCKRLFLPRPLQAMR